MEPVQFPSKGAFFSTVTKLFELLNKNPDLYEKYTNFTRNAVFNESILLNSSFSTLGMLEVELSEFLSGTEIQSPLKEVIQEEGDPDRIYMDGCFDLMHSGHYNAIRQAKALGKVLVVGIHSDAEIARNKGPPVMNEIERYALARACKWIDEVIEDAPYSPTIELLNRLNCRYAAHGDDLSINENGDDCMAVLKRAGRCKIFKRTEGISTTQLVGKLLLMTKDKWEKVDTPVTSSSVIAMEVESNAGKKHLLTTSRRISEFSNKREAKSDDVIVYMDGTFDLFHVGHVEALRKAKALGDYLIVGVHDDAIVNKYKGSNFPIMSLNDRVMCVLSTRYVDEVIIGAPWVVTKELITGFGIKIVVQGTTPKTDPQLNQCRKGSIDLDEDPYIIPKELGIYQEIVSINSLSSQSIIDRIIDNRINYFNKFRAFTIKEKKYDENKQFIQEI